MKIIKHILIILGVILFIWFIIPFVFAGILNAGNGIGIIFSAVLFIYGIYFDKTNHFINIFWKKLMGKILLSLAFIILAAGIIFVIFATGKMILAAGNAPKEETTVVVLGCQVYPEGPSLMLYERLAAAYEYLSENKNVKCVLSGGQGEDEVMSEAQCMYDWLILKGIDKNRLYMEDKSTSTRENLLFSKKVIEENGLNPKITIVTNDFHQYRASRIAETLGFECYNVSGKTQIFLLPTYYVRELGGILYEMTG